MQIYNFVVLSVITASHNVPLLTLAKPIYLLLHLTFMNSNWIYLKRPVKEKGSPPTRVGVEAQIPPPSLNIHETELPLFIVVWVFRMWFSFASDAWAEMSLNELKWTQMSSKELEWV